MNIELIIIIFMIDLYYAFEQDHRLCLFPNGEILHFCKLDVGSWWTRNWITAWDGSPFFKGAHIRYRLYKTVQENGCNVCVAMETKQLCC